MSVAARVSEEMGTKLGNEVECMCVSVCGCVCCALLDRY